MQSLEEVFQRFRRLGRITVAVHATSFHFCTAGAAQRSGDRAGAGREVEVVTRTVGIAEAAVAALDGGVGYLKRQSRVHGELTIVCASLAVVVWLCHALG